MRPNKSRRKKALYLLDILTLIDTLLIISTLQGCQITYKTQTEINVKGGSKGGKCSPHNTPQTDTTKTLQIDDKKHPLAVANECT